MEWLVLGPLEDFRLESLQFSTQNFERKLPDMVSTL